MTSIGTDPATPLSLTEQSFGSSSANKNVSSEVKPASTQSSSTPVISSSTLVRPEGFASPAQGSTEMPRLAQSSVTAASANQHMSTYLQSYQTYGPATPEVSSAAPGQQLRAEDTQALTAKYTIVPFADRFNPLMPFDLRLHDVDPASGVPEPAPFGLVLCAGLGILATFRRKLRA